LSEERSKILALLLALSFSTGCPNPDPGALCDTDDDCSGVEVCVFDDTDSEAVAGQCSSSPSGDPEQDLGGG